MTGWRFTNGGFGKDPIAEHTNRELERMAQAFPHSTFAPEPKTHRRAPKKLTIARIEQESGKTITAATYTADGRVASVRFGEPGSATATIDPWDAATEELLKQ
jgi:hypothetical protein